MVDGMMIKLRGELRIENGELRMIDGMMIKLRGEIDN